MPWLQELRLRFGRNVWLRPAPHGDFTLPIPTAGRGVDWKSACILDDDPEKGMIKYESLVQASASSWFWTKGMTSAGNTPPYFVTGAIPYEVLAQYAEQIVRRNLPTKASIGFPFKIRRKSKRPKNRTGRIRAVLKQRGAI